MLFVHGPLGLRMDAFEQAWLLLKDFTIRPDKSTRAWWSPRTDWAGVNLPAYTRGPYQPKQPPEGSFRGRVKDSAELTDTDETRRAIAEDLLHEHGHRAIDSELWDAVERGELPREKLALAHEIGAYNLQHPGGWDADEQAHHRVRYHPDVDDDVWTDDNRASMLEGGRDPLVMPQPYVSE